MRVFYSLLYMCLYKWKFYKRAVTEFSFLRYDNDSNKKWKENEKQCPNTF